ncbi:MAG: PorT family protein [bacterium]|nr:PorT family protein [bacterium]
MPRSSISGCLLLSFVMALAASPAGAWYVVAGAGESDVGLHENGTSYTIGGGESWPVGPGPFDISAELSYLQRAGSQPLIFTNGVLPYFVDEASVTVHMVRPAIFGGVRLLEGRVVPRLYAGFSASVKVAESWEKPVGETNRVYGYEDLDAELHAGLSVGVGRFAVDFRYNHGLRDQLVDRDADNAGSWDKAQDDLEGIATPEGGARATSWQVGLSVGF